MIKFFLILATIIAIFVGCSNTNYNTKSIPFEHEIFAMDTLMKLKAYGDNASKSIDQAVEQITTLDNLWSVNKETSEVYLLNKNKQLNVSPDTKHIIQSALEVSRDTNYAFDITIFPVVKAWGFTTNNYHVPSNMQLKNLLTSVNSDFINIDNSKISFSNKFTEIDLGAIAKGYTSNKIMQVFKNNGVTSAIVDLGGNVQTLGAKPDGSPWSVAVQDPINPDKYIGVLHVIDKAIVTSGVYQRYFEQNGVTYHHILDTSTGKPVINNLASVTIICSDGAMADAYSTAMFVMGEEKATDFWKKNSDKFDMILVLKNGDILVTQNIHEMFDLTDNNKKISIVKK